MRSSEEIRVTRLVHGDYGVEARVEVELGGRIVELVVTDGIDGYQAALWLLGDPGEKLFGYRA